MAIHLDQLPYDPTEVYQNPLVEQTQSSMCEFLVCPTKYVLRYLLKIVPVQRPIHFTVGTACHAAWELILDPKNKKMKHNELFWAVTKAIDAIFDEVVENSDVAWSGSSDKLEHGRAQAHAVIRAWQIQYDWKSMFKVLHTELNIRAKKGATLKSPLMDRGAGKIDGLVVDLLDPERPLLLLEHKTRATLRDLDFVEGLSLDHQALWYMMLYENWALSERNAHKVKTDKMPVGFYYDAAAKPLHRGVEDFDGLITRMMDAMVQKPDQYFSLTPVMVEQVAVDRARDNFHRIVRDIDNLDPGNVKMNTRACNMYGGCQYRKICSSYPGAEPPVARPEVLLEMPQLDMYRIEGEHEELEEEAE